MAINLLEGDIQFDKSPINLLGDESGNPALLSKAGNIAQNYINRPIEASRLPALAGGALQGVGDIGASLANVPLQIIGKSIGKDIRIPHPNLGKYVDNDLLSKIAFGTGEVGSNLAGGMGAANAIGKIGGLTEKLSNIPKIGGIVARPAEGAITGAALGEDKEGNRGLGAEVGAVANPIVSTVKYAKSLMPENLAKTIMNAKSMAQEKYTNLYNGLFNEAKERGLGETGLRIPQIDRELIKSNATKKYYRSLEDFHENPTLENAHWAQSDMGKLARHLEKLQRNNPLTSEQLKMYQEVLEAQKKLRGSMFTALTKKGEQDLANKYGATTEGYARDVVPYDRNKAITDFQNKDITAEALADKLAKDQKFGLSMGQKHPEIQHSAMLRKFLSNIPWKTMIGTGIGSATGIGLMDKYKDSNQ